MAIPKKFLWRRRYNRGEKYLMTLSANDSIQIVNGPNQSSSTSILTVKERIPHDYRYRCRVVLNLTADNIFAKTDVYPITVSGKPP